MRRSFRKGVTPGVPQCNLQVTDTRKDLHEIEVAGREASRAMEKPQGLLTAR